MEEHGGNGVHIHLQTIDQDGGHHHDTQHISTDGDGKDAHVYLHMDMHGYDEHNDISHHDSHEFDDLHHHTDDHHDGDDDHDHDDESGEEKMKHPKKTHYFYSHGGHHHHHHDMIEAHCDMMSNDPAKQFTGHIHLKQITHDLLSVHVDLDCPADVKPGTKLGLHVHEARDLTDRCNTLGGHYNPDNVHHGARTAGHNHRHIGDWGNVVCDLENEVEHEFYERVAQLSGPHSIMNRSIVLHMGHDDHGLGTAADSKTTGHAGARLACCIITKKMDGDDHH